MKKPAKRKAKAPAITDTYVPEISYIVSAYDRPQMLPICLHSIKCQSHQDFEVIVTDNAINDALAKANEQAVKLIGDPRFRYVRTAHKITVSDCYYSAEWAIKHLARGRWYAFPCDDTYLVPEFGERMLTQAIRDNAKFVYCEKVLVGTTPGGGYESGYHLWTMAPRRTTKTTFIVRASVFPGFNGKTATSGANLADYILCAQLMEAGVKITSVPGVCLLVHN